LPDDDATNEEPPGAPPGDTAPTQPPGGVTDSGYSYTVVDDDAAEGTPAPAPAKAPSRTLSLPLWALAAAVIVPAVVVGALAWGLATTLDDDGGGAAGGGDRLAQNVTNVVNAFSQGGEGTTGLIRYEGALPPAFPEEIPIYPGSSVISSIVQIRGADATYTVVFDSSDPRQDVASFFEDAFSQDPWQVEVTQTGLESSLVQFSNIENPDIEGLELSAESKSDDVTTIFLSVGVVGAAADNQLEDFDPGQTRPLPAGFPAEQVPQYPDSTIIETGFQRAPSGRQFIASMVTQDAPADVLQFYRTRLEDIGWTVEDAPAGTSSLTDGSSMTFTSDDGATTGTIEAGALAEDGDFTRVNIQVATPSS